MFNWFKQAATTKNVGNVSEADHRNADPRLDIRTGGEAMSLGQENVGKMTFVTGNSILRPLDGP